MNNDTRLRDGSRDGLRDGLGPRAGAGSGGFSFGRAGSSIFISSRGVGFYVAMDCKFRIEHGLCCNPGLGAEGMVVAVCRDVCVASADFRISSFGSAGAGCGAGGEDGDRIRVKESSRRGMIPVIIYSGIYRGAASGRVSLLVLSALARKISWF